ncbi:50S ribosomal protein L13 [Litorimonas sp. RW-G-Af-16]|uniref:50S ribosomal protein L13 n=1 Tax=Litorimonas sp. RW-G-Af-16 TaxID=3241168 RepID=UPI00390CA31C
MKTTKFLKTAEIEKKWILIDAEGVVTGRLATFVAMRLRGKHLPNYTPHMDHGDNVIIINAEKVAFTGKKRTDKVYYWHTGYPGGLKERTADKILDGRFPERVFKKAVQRMLPKESPLARKQLSNLKIYAGSEHPHSAQNPEVIDFKSMSSKNTKGG